MFDGVWSMKASKALRDEAVWRKANSHYAKKQRKRVETGKIRKHLLFESPHTLKEETFAISRFLPKFAKVCSREIFVIYKSRKFILAKKKEFETRESQET